MGSWDACCGISKLPINIGDEVCDFFIGEVGSFRDSGFICYPNDLWTPITIQTYGKYDDYGQIRTDSGSYGEDRTDIGWHVEYVVNMLKKNAIELEEGENEYHDIPIKPDEMTYDLAQEAIHEGRLFLPAPRWSQQMLQDMRDKAKSPRAVKSAIIVSRMMIHRFVFDGIVSWGLDTWSHGKMTLDDLVQDGMTAIEAYLKEQAECTDEFRRIHNEFRFIDMPSRNSVFVGAFRGTESGDTYVPHRFKDYMSLLLQPDLPNRPEVVTELAKFIIFRARMHEMQFLWTPQTGSQHHAYAELSKLYQMCDAHAQAEMRKYDEEEEDE